MRHLTDLAHYSLAIWPQDFQYPPNATTAWGRPQPQNLPFVLVFPSGINKAKQLRS